MAEGTEQHLEHAEHAQHAAHDPFNKRVAMTMAIAAAVLAFVTMLSHRAHNQTLHLQGEAGQLRTQATTYHTQASDQWGYFQAKKQRMYLYGAHADLAIALGKPRGPKEAVRANRDKMFPVSAAAKEPQKPDKTGDKKAKQARKDKKPPTDPVALASWWKGLAKDYRKEANDIENEARKLVAKGEAKEHEAEEKLHESHQVHEQADRLDFGHLGLEMALVLCSVALLSRQAGFWYTGVGVGIVGLCVSLSAYLMH